MRRLVPVSLGALGATIALIVALVAPAAASAADRYVALGDSSSAGVGAGDHTDESGDCDRSPHAYPQLYADAVAPASAVSVAAAGRPPRR